MSSTGGVRGGGRSSGPKGGSAAGKASAPKASGGFGKVESSESVEGTSRHVSALGETSTDPVTHKVLQIARELQSGLIKSKDEATRRFVATVLKEKLRMQSSALTGTIAETLQGDPRLSQTLERIWAKGANAAR